MKTVLTRRQFITASAALTAGTALGLGSPFKTTAAEAAFKTKLRKALIRNKPAAEDLKKLKDAGYDGVEAGILPVPEAEQCRAIADQIGMKIHSVLRGWAEFNSPDPAKVQQTFDVTVNALKAAQGFGADAVLLVPCRIGGMKMPAPWDFKLEFDPETGHLTKVAEGDNAPYADYIKAHNHATDTSRAQVKKLIPIAEQCGVVIALENVWNNLWVKPAHFANFVASFQSKWVGAYYDIGNHVKYAPSEEWISALGSLTVKLHAKDFKVDRAAGSGGKFVNIREGDVNWPVVRQTLERVGHSGWLTIEGGNCSLEEHSKRLDLIIAGK